MRDVGWRLVHDPADMVIVDVAAGRPVPSLLDSQQVELAYRHGLLGLIEPAATTDPATTTAARHRSGARAAVMRRRLDDILRRLHRGGVRAAVLKGPFLDTHVYPAEGMRAFTDVDVLVPAGEVEQAVRLLLEDPLVTVPPRGPKASKRDVVVRDPTGVVFTLDLHWDLFSHTQLLGRAGGASEEAWAAATFAPDDPLGPSWRLPDSALYCFLALHATLDHRFRLVLFRDLAEWWRSPRDIDALVAFARRHGLASFVGLASAIAQRAVGAAVPSAVSDLLGAGGLPGSVASTLLARADLVRFDGRSRLPANLAVMLLADDRAARRHLGLRAPFAFRSWRRRVGVSPVTGRRRILILVTSNQRRGAEVFADHLGEGLAGRGWDVEVVAMSAPEGDVPRTGAIVLDPAVKAVSGLRARLVVALGRRVRSRRPGVVLANGGATLRYALAATRLLPGRPRLVYYSIGEPMYWVRNRRHLLTQRMLFSGCDRVLAVSTATRRQVVDRIGVAPTRVEVAPTGTSPRWLEVATDPTRQPLRVLFIGALSAEKDPATALAALAAAPEDVVLRFVGDGALRADLEGEVARRGLGPRVEFTGAVADVAPHLGWAGCLILTSRTEGLPGVVLESAAAGLPVIAADVGGVGDAVVHDVTGLLVPPGDPARFAAAIARLAADPDLRASMGEAGRRHVEAAFLLDRSLDRFDMLLRQTMEAAR